MATTFIQNLEKLNTSGVKMPANTPSAVSPDNITHCQLRYTPFGSEQAIQGTVVTGENSTFAFSIPDGQIAYVWKLYTSTDGTTYSENKTFGGSSGKALFGTNDLSNYVALTGNQTIAGVKTFSSVPECATTPTTASQLTRKAYVDNLIGYKSCVFWVSSFTPNESTALSYTRIYNNTGYTPTLAYLAASGGSDLGLRVTFNRTSSNSDVILPSALIWEDGWGVREKAGHLAVIESFAQSSANTAMDLIFVDDYGFSSMGWFSEADSSSALLRKFTLSGSTLNESTAATDPGANEFIAFNRAASNIAWEANYNVTSTAELKNFRIELRFYD